MADNNRFMVWTGVAVCTCAQLMVRIDRREEMADACRESSKWAWLVCSSMQMPAMSWFGIWSGGCVAIWWMSSGSIVFGGWEAPVGCLDKVSDALFLTPGM